MCCITYISDKIINCYLEVIIIIILSINLLFFIYYPEIANGQDNDNPVVPLFENNSSQPVPWIGADVVNVKEGIANVLGVKERIGVSGVLVTEVAPGSPAEEAGLLEGNESVRIDEEEIKLGGDIIIQADNKTINSTIDYNELLRQKKDGDILTLTVLRGDQPNDIPVVVGSRLGFVYESSSRYADPGDIDFESYESFDLEFEISYPSQWEKVEKEGSNSILFESNPENPTDNLREFVEVSFEPRVGNGILQERNSRNETILRMENLLQNETSGEIRFSNSFSTTIPAGNPARIVEYNFILPPVGEINAKEITIINGNELYRIRYFAEESKFDDYLPTVQSMIDSFNISAVREYENFDAGVRIKYSDSSWNFLDESHTTGHNVRFISPVENSSTAHEGKFRIFAQGPFDRLTLEQRFNDTIQYWESEFEDTKRPNFRLINSTSSHLENMNKIHNVTYSFGDPDRGINIRTHIITIQNDRLYIISYSFGQGDHSKHAPVINKMIESIEFFIPTVHADTNLGLLLQYPSDVSIIDQKDNGSIIFSFGSNIDSDAPFVEPQFAINVYTKENSTHNDIYHDIAENNKNKRYEINTTSQVPVDNLFFTYQGTDSNNTLQVNATFKNKKYNFKYSAEPDEYHQFISTVETIINSTKIIDSNLDETNKSGFAHYNNSAYGFTMEHPSEWHPIEYGNGLVQFKQNKSDENTTLSFTIQVVAAENWKIYDFVEDDIKYYIENFNDFQIIRSNPTNHSAYDAYELEYIIGGNSMWTDKYVLNDENKHLYYVSYGGELNEFYTSLPIIQEMIRSLEFNQISEPRTYTGFKVADNPTGMAVNPRTNTIYVAHTSANTVSAINGSDNEILTDIAVSNSPIAIAVNPIKNTVYVTHQSSHNGSISVIDGKNSSRVANIPLDMKSPMSLAVNPFTDRLYVADSESRNVSIIDTSTNKVVDSIATGRNRSVFAEEYGGIGIAVDSLRNRIYVANPSTGNITVIDGLDNSILTNISTSFRQANTSDFISPFDTAVIRPFDIAVNQYTNIGYVVGYVEYRVGDGENSEKFYDQRLAAIDFANNRIMPYNVNGSFFGSFNVVAINPFANIIYLNDVIRDIFYGINAKEPDSKPVANITLDDVPSVLSVDSDANIIYVTNLHSDTVSKINGNTNKVMYGVRFDINDGPVNKELFLGYNISINPSKSININCGGKNISDNDYVHYDNGTEVICWAHPKHFLSPLIISSWPGFNSNPYKFTVTQYETLTVTLIDLESLLQTVGPYISLVVLVGVVLAASVPSFSPKIRKVFGTRKREAIPVTAKEEATILSKPEIITVDATVIIGVLIFITFTEGFEIAEQTQITMITANIVFPFAISAVVAVRNYDKFAIRLMIAGFINLMISIILIAIMRL